MADYAAAVWVDVSPPVGGTVNVPVSDSRVPIRLCINSSGVLGSLTLAWPITGVADGQTVAVNAMSAVTLVSHTAPAGGSMRGGAASLVAGANGIYVFRLANLTWYKF